MSPANHFLPLVFTEQVQRLALGLEPIDQATGARVPHYVEAALENVPQPPTTLYHLQPWEWLGQKLPRFPRHPSCHYVLVYRPGLRTTVDLRLFDPRRRYVARRFEITVASEADVVAPETDPTRPPVPLADRVFRPRMYPGAAYNVSESSTGLRGQVLRDGAPMPWARIEARQRNTGAVVGRAHGDDRGEFLLLIAWRGSYGTPPVDPMPLAIRVYGPTSPPTEAYPLESRVDELWGLPRETPAWPQPPGGDEVANGIQRMPPPVPAVPPGYQPTTTPDVDVDLPLGRFNSAGYGPFVFSAI